MTDEELSDFTILGWCKHHKYSPSTFYKLDRERRAPRTYQVGRTRRITRAADRDWVRESERETESEAAQLAAERRRELARHAGLASAASPKHITKQPRRKQLGRRRS
jgi:hypothetical protein